MKKIITLIVLGIFICTSFSYAAKKENKKSTRTPAANEKFEGNNPKLLSWAVCSSATENRAFTIFANDPDKMSYGGAIFIQKAADKKNNEPGFLITNVVIESATWSSLVAILQVDGVSIKLKADLVSKTGQYEAANKVVPLVCLETK